MSLPLPTTSPLSSVTVVCIAHNHENYVEQALVSLKEQSYPRLQIIVIDNGSTDKTLAKIQALKNTLDFHLIALKENIGNCKAFNIGLAKAKGKYIIDLATDDFFVPNSIIQQAKALDNSHYCCVAVFSNVIHTNAEGKIQAHQYSANEYVPDGMIYSLLLRRRFISAPSMMIKTDILRQMGGYDESLSFEDFDFWVRSARKFSYTYLPIFSICKRKHKHNSSAHFYEKQNRHLASVFCVCKKVMLINYNEEENKALASAIRYHLRQSLFTQHFTLVKKFYHLLKYMNQENYWDIAIVFLARLRISLRGLYKIYRRIRYT